MEVHAMLVVLVTLPHVSLLEPTLHCFLIRTSALDAHDLFEHGTL